MAPQRTGEIDKGPATADRPRCDWCGDDPVYVAYHDDEWGYPVTDERDLFEKLLLDGAQAGLSWITILRKRTTYEQAFDGFDPERMAAYDESDFDRLMADAGIVRNRAKIRAFIGNAQALLAMHEAGETLSELVWSHRPAEHQRPQRPGEVQAFSPESEALSKALKKRGFRFVGPTIVYAFMQAVGVVDDHYPTCFRASAAN